MAKKKKTDEAPPKPVDGGKPYEERSRRELYLLAQELGIEGRSRMAKGELIRVLQKQ